MVRGFVVMVLGATLGVPPAGAQQLERFTAAHDAMGTRFRIVLYATDEREAGRATSAAFRRIDELDRTLSDYDPASEISRLSHTAGSGRWVSVGADLWAVLVQSNELAIATGGAFDVTVGPLTRLWRWAGRRDVLPEPDRIARAQRAVGHRLIEYDHAARRVRLAAPGMRLDVGAIGKGFAADQALRLLRDRGIRIALVDAGGDVVAGARPPGTEGWRVESPSVAAGARATRTTWLEYAAIATSGDTYRFVEVDGVRYSHIIDPGTGFGVTTRRIVTVVAPTAAEADALASALSVIGPVAGQSLLERRAGTFARVLERQGKVWREFALGFAPVDVADEQHNH